MAHLGPARTNEQKITVTSVNDGVNDDVDAYPFSDTSPLVVIGTCDSGVANQTLASGATFNDLIAQAAADADNHGDFVSAVSQLANDWNKDGLISGQEKGKITSCAAQSNLPATATPGGQRNRIVTSESSASAGTIHQLFLPLISLQD